MSNNKLPISVVIPTYNEERYLPLLLESIANQTKLPSQIIVADAFSADKTRQIAKSYGARVVDGGSPARGRNKGAKVATQQYIFFLDADVILPKDFFGQIYREIRERKLDVGSCLGLLTPHGLQDRIITVAMNNLLRSTEKILPHSGPSNIFIKRSLHKKIKGFDESLFITEDHDYVERASKLGKHGYIKSVKVYFSNRRLEAEGRTRLIVKYVYSTLYRILFGPIRKEIYKYEFDKHHKY